MDQSLIRQQNKPNTKYKFLMMPQKIQQSSKLRFSRILNLIALYCFWTFFTLCFIFQGVPGPLGGMTLVAAIAGTCNTLFSISSEWVRTKYLKQLGIGVGLTTALSGIGCFCFFIYGLLMAEHDTPAKRAEGKIIMIYDMVTVLQMITLVVFFRTYQAESHTHQQIHVDEEKQDRKKGLISDSVTAQASRRSSSGSSNSDEGYNTAEDDGEDDELRMDIRDQSTQSQQIEQNKNRKTYLI